MGAEIAVTTANPGTTFLNNFNSTIIAKMKLTEGNWVILGRVVLGNGDGDYQSGTAQILHDANVVIDQALLWLLGGERVCISLQGTLSARGDETITLNCNTYKGEASSAALLAFKVDQISMV